MAVAIHPPEEGRSERGQGDVLDRRDEIKMTAGLWRVLVVDGDAEVRDVVEDLLIDRGFEVHQAADEDEAVSELHTNTFDVLLCHLTLLRSGHEQLCRSVHEVQPNTRVVAMSASGAHARRDEASANLPKPFTRLQLLEALRPS
jgi:CheY-like chemotaxis protein